MPPHYRAAGPPHLIPSVGFLNAARPPSSPIERRVLLAAGCRMWPVRPIANDCSRLRAFLQKHSVLTEIL